MSEEVVPVASLEDCKHSIPELEVSVGIIRCQSRKVVPGVSLAVQENGGVLRKESEPKSKAILSRVLEVFLFHFNLSDWVLVEASVCDLFQSFNASGLVFGLRAWRFWSRRLRRNRRERRLFTVLPDNFHLLDVSLDVNGYREILALFFHCN